MHVLGNGEWQSLLEAQGQETASSLTFSSSSCPLLAPQKDLGDGFSQEPRVVTFTVLARCGLQSQRFPTPLPRMKRTPKPPPDWCPDSLLPNLRPTLQSPPEWPLKPINQTMALPCLIPSDDFLSVEYFYQGLQGWTLQGLDHPPPSWLNPL